MVASLNQIAFKPADLKSEKSSEIVQKEQSFSSFLSQEIKQNEKKVTQKEKQKKYSLESDETSTGAKLAVLAQSTQVTTTQAQPEQSLAINAISTLIDEEAVVEFLAENVIAIDFSPENVVQPKPTQISETVITDVVVKPMFENELSKAKSVLDLQGKLEQTAEMQNTQISADEMTQKVDGMTQKAEEMLLNNKEPMPKQQSNLQQDESFVGQFQNQVQQSKTSAEALYQNENLKGTEEIQKVDFQSEIKKEQISAEKLNTGFLAKEEKLPTEKVEGAKVESKQHLEFIHNVDKTNTVSSAEGKEVVDQVLNHIEANFNAKTSEFSFNLYPRELGKVAVKMIMEKGMLIVEFAASSAKTQSILAANANQIRELLLSQPLQRQPQFVDVSQNVQPQAHDYLKDESQNNQGRNQSFAQNEKNQNSGEAEQQFTADFLSVMQMMNETMVLESW